MTPAEIDARTDDWLEGSKFSPLFNSGWGDYDHDYPAIPVVAAFPRRGVPSWILDLYNPSLGSSIAADPAKRTQLLAQAIPSLSTPVGQKALFTLEQQGGNHNMPALYANAAIWPPARGIDLATDIPNWHHSDVREVAFFYVHLLFDQIKVISEQ